MDNGWIVEQSSFLPEDVEKFETLFSLGNGSLGLRGNLEDENAVYQKGTYINGFYELSPIQYGESAFGYPKNNQSILNLPDGKTFCIYADGELFETANAVNHIRTFDMKNGILRRRFSWKTISGTTINVVISRIVSFMRLSVAVQSIDFSIDGEIESLKIVSSLLNASPEESTANFDDPRKNTVVSDGGLYEKDNIRVNSRVIIKQETKRSGLFLVTGMDHDYPSELCNEINYSVDTEGYRLSFRFHNLSGKFRFVKYLSYQHGAAENVEQGLISCMNDLDFCQGKNPEYFTVEQSDYLSDFWKRSDIQIRGNSELQRAVRFNLFHLVQSAGKDGKTSISAKGLSGLGYDGHYFWDSEVYIVPFFIYTSPDIARALLSFRFSVLDKARKRAEELSHKGALFPWRTINGDEASAYFPAGTAQYHINADICYSMNKYIETTRDITFLKEAGFEIFIETARFWYDLGNYIPRKGGSFCIHEVTGPDEYSALVNNNFYTNIMAKDNLETAVKWYDWLKEKEQLFFKHTASRLNLTPDERDDWEEAASKMYLPYDEKYGIFPQDDAFLDRPVWNFESTPEDRYPLLLHYHPLDIYRFQVLKQADVVMALFLKSSQFTIAEKKRTFDYYEKLTTGDSSLSAAIQGVVALELGDYKKGFEYFLKTVYMDYHDINGNVKDGIHTAAMGGSWVMIIYGFAGMRERNGELHFSPHLPDAMHQLSFKIKYKKRLFEVSLRRREISYTLTEGEAFSVFTGGVRTELSRHETVSVLY